MLAGGLQCMVSLFIWFLKCISQGIILRKTWGWLSSGIFGVYWRNLPLLQSIVMEELNSTYLWSFNWEDIFSFCSDNECFSGFFLAPYSINMNLNSGGVEEQRLKHTPPFILLLIGCRAWVFLHACISQSSGLGHIHVITLWTLAAALPHVEWGGGAWHCVNKALCELHHLVLKKNAMSKLCWPILGMRKLWPREMVACPELYSCEATEAGFRPRTLDTRVHTLHWYFIPYCICFVICALIWILLTGRKKLLVK